METERSNLPADLPILASEIDAALVPQRPSRVTETAEQQLSR